MVACEWALLCKTIITVCTVILSLVCIITLGDFHSCCSNYNHWFSVRIVLLFNGFRFLIETENTDT